MKTHMTPPNNGTFLGRTGLGMCLPFLLLGVWVTCGCALQPLARDLSTYLNRDIYGISELESIALRRYADQTGENFISDQALRTSLNAEIIPVYTRFSDLAGQIEPGTQPVQELHALYLKAAALRLRGFQMVLLAIDSQDPDLVLQANEMLHQGQLYISRWQKELATMAKEYGLKTY